MEIPVSLPLDSDGFLRRECPTCEQQFKWFNHAEGSADAETVDQYFCPLCGVAAGVDSWWTPTQLAFMEQSVGPALDDLVKDAFGGIKSSKHFQFMPNKNFSFEIPTPDPLTEPNDMLIVESPCHTNEPVKVPEAAASSLHCLVCGSTFAA